MKQREEQLEADYESRAPDDVLKQHEGYITLEFPSQR